MTRTNQRALANWPNNAVSVLDYGAVGDGVTDDTAAINEAVASNNGTATGTVSDVTLFPPGTFNFTGDKRWKGLVSLGGGGPVRTDGAAYPRSLINLGGGDEGTTLELDKTLNASDTSQWNLNVYSQPQGAQIYAQYRALGTPQDTQGTQIFQNITSLANGADVYGTFVAGSVSQRNDMTPTAWGEQNSCGMYNGQINATTDNVNLYGLGDIVLNDNSKSSVSMYGQVLLLYRNGTDGTYNVPRVGQVIKSIGSQPIDSLIQLGGKTNVGIDANALPTGVPAISLGENTPITFNDTYSGDPQKVTVGDPRIRYVTETLRFEAGVSGGFLFRNGLSTSPTTLLEITDSGQLYPASDKASSLGAASKRFNICYADRLRPGDGSVTWTSGPRSPEGAVVGVVGSLYTNTVGGAGTTLWIKESGTGNTGWVAK